MLIAVYLIVGLVYLCCPAYLKLVLCVVNIFVPDAIPVIDEVLMVAGLFVNG